MAGREQSIDYIINASIGSAFQSTFTKAQSEFTRLGKEIQNVQRVQRDVSAWQRQEKAFQNTGAKLDNLQQQYALLETQIAETKEPTAELEREKLKLQMRIDDTALALERQRGKLNATQERLKDAGISTDDLTSADAKLTEQLAELREEQDKAAQSAKEYTETASSGLADVGQALASAGIVVGLKKIADAYADCVQTSAGFEGAMSKVAALSGASQGEMEALSGKAKEMGAATQYTAQESAEAFGYMALAGWNAEQMLSGIAPVLDLAAASGMDLAQASDIVTDYLTAFGLGASDAARFVDQMAYAQAHSNTTTTDLGEAYKNAAATAHSLGYSVEDTTAVLMAMANAGVKGGEAGSGLSTIMTRLATNTKNCADELGEFGVKVYENGKMRGLSDIIWDTARAFDGLSDEEQANLAKAIAGTNQYAKFQTILAGMSENAKAGGQSIMDYSAALENCSGAAGKMADIMLDNLSGDLTRLDSAVDAVKISLGGQFTPELRKLAQAGTDVLSGVNRFIERNPAAVKAITLLTGVMGSATAGVVAYSAAVKAAKSLGLKDMLLSAGPFLGVTAAVGGLAAAYSALKTEWEAAIPAAIELHEATEDLNRTLEETSIRDVENEAQANAAAAEMYLDKIEELGAVQNRTREQEIRYQGALAGLLEVAPELSDCISQTAGKYGDVTYAVNGSTEAIRANIGAMKQQAIMAALQSDISEITEKRGKAVVSVQLAEINKADLEDQYRNVLDRRDEIQRKLDAAAGRSHSEDTAAEIRHLNEEMHALDLQYGLVFDQAKYFDAQIAQGNETIAKADEELLLYNKAMDGVTEELGAAGDSAGGFAAGTDEAAESAADAAGPLEALTEDAEKLAAAYQESYDEALKAIQGQYALWDEAEKTAPSDLGGVEKAMESQIANWTARTENLEALSQYVGDVSGLYTLIGELSRDTSQESTNLLAGLAGAANREDLETLRKFAGVYVQKQESEKKAAETTISLMPELAEASGNLQELLDESVEGMDKSEASQAAARETIQAYIDEANDPSNLAAIRTAFGRAASEALRALNARGGMTQEFLIQIGAEHYTPHAEGGILAQPHIGLVAEDGPEAVIPLSASRRDRGAEIWEEAGRRMGLLNAAPAAGRAGTAGWAAQSLPSDMFGTVLLEAAVSTPDASMNAEPLEAMPFPGFSSAPANVEIHIHLEAGANKEAVDALDDLVHRGELKEAFLEVFEDMVQDKKRLAFS